MKSSEKLELSKLTDDVLDAIAGGAIYHNPDTHEYEILRESDGTLIWSYPDRLSNADWLSQIQDNKHNGHVKYLTKEEYENLKSY